MSEVEVNAEQLKSFIERIEKVDDDRLLLVQDIKEIYDEAKSVGYDTKIMKMLVKIRRMDKDKRQEQEAILDLYMNALGIS